MNKKSTPNGGYKAVALQHPKSEKIAILKQLAQRIRGERALPLNLSGYIQASVLANDVVEWARRGGPEMVKNQDKVGVSTAAGRKARL